MLHSTFLEEKIADEVRKIYGFYIFTIYVNSFFFAQKNCTENVIELALAWSAL